MGKAEKTTAVFLGKQTLKSNRIAQDTWGSVRSATLTRATFQQGDIHEFRWQEKDHTTVYTACSPLQKDYFHPFPG